MTNGRRCLPVALAAVFAACAHAAEPKPVVVQSAPGQFEIAAVDASRAHAIAAIAQEGWRILAGPLGLPESFSSPVFVHMVAGEARETAPFRVWAEPGGIVSIELRSAGLARPILQRALVQALLLRLAVARHGVHARLAVPLWLEQGGTVWWQTRADAAKLDAVKQETAALAPPGIVELLSWRRGGDEPRSLSIAALWLFTFLQSESSRVQDWHAFVVRSLGGEPPEAALAAVYGARFQDAAERELWWQTGWHHARRARTLPTLEAADSRAELGALSRFVFGGNEEAEDVVVPLAQVLGRAHEPIVSAELARRETELRRLLTSLHPFYRNAGLSLSDAFRSKASAQAPALAAVFEQDWRDAVELETATALALDGLAARARP